MTSKIDAKMIGMGADFCIEYPSVLGGPTPKVFCALARFMIPVNRLFHPPGLLRKAFSENVGVLCCYLFDAAFIANDETLSSSSRTPALRTGWTGTNREVLFVLAPYPSTPLF